MSARMGSTCSFEGGGVSGGGGRGGRPAASRAAAASSDVFFSRARYLQIEFRARRWVSAKARRWSG